MHYPHIRSPVLSTLSLPYINALCWYRSWDNKFVLYKADKSYYSCNMSLWRYTIYCGLWWVSAFSEARPWSSELGLLVNPAGSALFALKTIVPWHHIFVCSSKAEDGDLCCTGTLIHLWSWPHSDAHRMLRKQSAYSAQKRNIALTVVLSFWSLAPWHPSITDTIFCKMGKRTNRLSTVNDEYKRISIWKFLLRNSPLFIGPSLCLR